MDRQSPKSLALLVPHAKPENKHKIWKSLFAGKHCSCNEFHFWVNWWGRKYESTLRLFITSSATSGFLCRKIIDSIVKKVGYIDHLLIISSFLLIPKRNTMYFQCFIAWLLLCNVSCSLLKIRRLGSAFFCYISKYNPKLRTTHDQDINGVHRLWIFLPEIWTESIC